MVQLEFIDGAATPDPLDPSEGDIPTVALKYGGNEYLAQEDWQTNIFKCYVQSGGLMPVDGVVTFDRGIRRGLDARRDWLDAINNQQITDLTAEITVQATITAGNCYGVFESLEQATY